MGYELGILFGILSMLGFGLSNAISQKLIRKVGEINAMVYQALVTGFILFPLFFIYPANFSFSLYHIGIALIIALIGVIPLFTFYKALRMGKVGVVVPVANSASLFTVIFSVIFLGETLTTMQLSSIAMIILGIILISVKISDFKSANNIAAGVPYALATSLLWGVFFFLYKFPVSVLGPIFSAAIIQLGIFGFTTIYELKAKKLIFKIDNEALKNIIITGIGLSVGMAASASGIALSNVSIVVPLVFSAVLVSTIYASIFYKEKLEKLQYVALLMIVGGIVLLSV